MKPSTIAGACSLAMLTVTLAAQGAERMTAKDMIARIASGQTTAEASLAQSLDAVAELSELNAMAHLDTAGAQRAASAIDESSPPGPLAGLVIVVKDNIQVAGLPNAAGTPALQEAIAKSNAPVVQRLVDAGVVVLGTSNMHELAFGISGWNPTYQTGSAPGVRNPYDRARFAGGSSSGTGALVGSGVIAAGLGTDTGGSVRIPAAVNGVSGLRPTLGRYPTEGIVPISHTRDTPGIIAASVADIALLDSVITGEKSPEATDLSGIRLGIGGYFVADLGPDVQAVWEATLARLQDEGVILVEVDDSDVIEANSGLGGKVALTEANVDLREYLDTHFPEISLETVVDTIASPDVKGTYDALVLPGLLPGPDGLVEGASLYDTAIAETRPTLIQAYKALFADNDIEALLFPTVPQVAVEATPEASSQTTFAAFIRNTDPGSNAALPGLSIAAGLGATTGMPVGIELDGPAGSDLGLLAIGMAIEEVLGLTSPPTLK